MRCMFCGAFRTFARLPLRRNMPFAHAAVQYRFFPPGSLRSGSVSLFFPPPGSLGEFHGGRLGTSPRVCGGYHFGTHGAKYTLMACNSLSGVQRRAVAPRFVVSAVHRRSAVSCLVELCSSAACARSVVLLGVKRPVGRLTCTPRRHLGPMVQRPLGRFFPPGHHG